MTTLHIANTIITNRAQALATRLNYYAIDSHSFEGHLACDTMQAQLVDAGFITWEDVEKAW